MLIESPERKKNQQAGRQGQTEKVLDDMPVVMVSLGHAYAVSGKREEAIRMLNELKGSSERRYVSPYDLSRVYLGLGDTDKLFECLQKVFEDRSEFMIFLKVDSALDSVRSDPRFAELLRRIESETDKASTVS